MSVSFVPSKPPTNFPLFKKFPPELRLRVWRLVLLVPRDIFIDLNHDLDEEKLNKHSPLRCKNPVPALLHVNREARTEAIACFTQIFLCYPWPFIHHLKDGRRETFDDTGYPDDKYVEHLPAEAKMERRLLIRANAYVFQKHTPRIYMHPSLDRLVIMGDLCSSHLAIDRLEAVLHKYQITRIAFPLHIYNDYDWLDNRMPRWGILTSFAVREISFYHDQVSRDDYVQDNLKYSHSLEIDSLSMDAGMGETGWIKGDTSPFNDKKYDRYHIDQLDPATHPSWAEASENYRSWRLQKDKKVRLVCQLIWAKDLIQRYQMEKLEENAYLRRKHREERASAKWKARSAESVEIDDYMPFDDVVMTSQMLAEGDYHYSKNTGSACEIKLVRLVFEERPKKPKLRLVMRNRNGARK